MLQVQFMLVCIHSGQLLFIECNYPTLFVYWIGAYAVIFLALFAEFYVQAYKKAPSPKINNNNGVVMNGNHKTD